MSKRKYSHKIKKRNKKRNTKSKYKKRKRKTVRKKRYKYKRITRSGRQWIKQMEIFMKSVQ